MENRSFPNFNWLYAIVLILAVGLCGVGIYFASTHQGLTMLAAGVVSLVAVLVTWPVTMSITAARQARKDDQGYALGPINDKLVQLANTLNMVSNQQLLSDRAKSIAYRKRDLEALRSAIKEEMSLSDWEAALVLANEIGVQFGYKQEADRLRDVINDRRQEVVQQQITDAISVIDKHARSEQWALAAREAERLREQFPHVEQVLNLPREIETRRTAHKKQLLESWHESVTRKDIDGSIEILKKLDLYLTPTEAESMQETARGIFKEKLNSLRTQFSVAVQDHNWTEAARVGDIIIADFPNTRVAQEVKEKMAVLKERAGTTEPARV